MSNNIYKSIERTATLEEYESLCISVGWKEFMNFDVVEKSLAKSLYGVIVEFENEVIGMGRIIGDGFIYYYIQDIVVSPKHQKQGIGKKIMDKLMDYIRHNAPEKAFVGIFSSREAIRLYEQYGFKQYPELTGIFRVTPID